MNPDDVASASSGAALAAAVARQVADSFPRHDAAFGRITRRAPQRLDSRNWRTAQADAVERIDL